MATFVLVHGAWHGSWCWKRVRRALQQDGHDVFTPTLTGVADRSHLASAAIDLETHVADVVNLIRWEELDDLVLCGHSYAGCVVGCVADRLRERVRALVYLDAFVLEDGQSLHDAVPPELRDAQVEAARAGGDGWLVPPIPGEFFNVNEADRAWMDAQCTAHPLATLQQRVTLRNPPDPRRVIHVLATGYAGSPFRPFHELARSKGWRTATVSCGHDVMLDAPEDVVRILREAAAIE